MKRYIWISMLVLLVGCTKNDDDVKVDVDPVGNENPEEEVEKVEEVEEVEKVEEVEAEEAEVETGILSQSYFAQLKAGKMPESEIQFTDKAGDIQARLGEPNVMDGYEGAMFFGYDEFVYFVPYDWTDGDELLAISKKIDEPLTAQQLIDAWGEPDEAVELEELNPGVFIYSYNTEDFRIIFESDGGLEGEVMAVRLQKIND